MASVSVANAATRRPFLACIAAVYAGRCFALRSETLKLYRTHSGWVVDDGGALRRLAADRTGPLTAREDLERSLTDLARQAEPVDAGALNALRPPIENQEIWAAGVTYFRSRTARMEESKVAAGSRFYDLVYNADRPELFFK